MTACSDERLADGARRELVEHILPFWRKHTVDLQRGGFVAEMSNDLRLNETAAKGLILNARILWTFAAAYRYTQSDHDARLAHRAYDVPARAFPGPAARRFSLAARSAGTTARQYEENLRTGVRRLCAGRILSHVRRFTGAMRSNRCLSADRTIQPRRSVRRLRRIAVARLATDRRRAAERKGPERKEVDEQSPARAGSLHESAACRGPTRC